jgi:hypothetical protein
MGLMSSIKNFDITRTDLGRKTSDIFGGKTGGSDFSKGVGSQAAPAQQAMTGAAANNSTPFAQGGLAHPVASPWVSMLDGGGRLQSQYVMDNPALAKAQGISTSDLMLHSGGTLGANALTGDYSNVGIGSILGDTQKRLDAIQADPTAMNLLRQKATQQGPSAWANMQKQQQGLQEQNALDASAKSNAGAMQNAMGSIAMRGGLSSGASERAARAGAMNQALAAQGVRRAGMSDRLNIDMADEAQKNDLLKQMPGQELAWLQPSMDKAKMLTGVQSDEQARKLQADMSNRDALFNKDTFNSKAQSAADQFNIQNAQDVEKTNNNTVGDARKFYETNRLAADEYNIGNQMQTAMANNRNLMGEVDAGRQNDQGNFQTQMASWAAGKTADAQGKGGKK